MGVNKKQKNYKWLVGIDEVGRGPLAGPVTVGLFAINVKEGFKENLRVDKKFFRKILEKVRIDDSKDMTEKQREETFEFLKKEKFYFSVMHMNSDLIDKKGIAVCIKELVDKQLKKLNKKNTFVVLDGGLKTDLYPSRTIIKGDSKFKVIGAAAIMAKVTRDRIMNGLSDRYPGYYFHEHKGYGTKKHIQAIKNFGICKIHRQSFLRKLL